MTDDPPKTAPRDPKKDTVRIDITDLEQSHKNKSGKAGRKKESK